MRGQPKNRGIIGNKGTTSQAPNRKIPHMNPRPYTRTPLHKLRTSLTAARKRLVEAERDVSALSAKEAELMSEAPGA